MDEIELPKLRDLSVKTDQQVLLTTQTAIMTTDQNNKLKMPLVQSLKKVEWHELYNVQTPLELMQSKLIFDESKIVEMLKSLPLTQVEKSVEVPVSPVQQPPKKEDYKANRELKKKRKAAQKICPEYDEYTFDTAAGLAQDKNSRSLTYTQSLINDCLNSKSNMNALRAFTKNFKVNKKGMPASDSDNIILEQNRQFIHDYSTGDTKLRKQHLDRITNEIINASFSLTPGMFTPELLAKNAAHYRHMSEMFNYFGTIQEENLDYFSKLPQFHQSLLEHQKKAGLVFKEAVEMHMKARAIDMQHGTIYNYSCEPDLTIVEQSKNDLEKKNEEFTRTLRQTKIDINSISSIEVENWTKEKMDELISINAEQDLQFSTKFGFSLPACASEQQYLDIQRYLDMIENNNDNYDANKGTIDRIFFDYYNITIRLCERLLPLNARQAVFAANIDPNNNAKAITRAAYNLQVKESDKIDRISNYLSSLMYAMEHLLLGTSLSNDNLAVFKQFLPLSKSGSQSNSRCNTPRAANKKTF